MCEHHLLPFYGVAHVAYIPNQEGRVVGASKLARLWKSFLNAATSRRMTSTIADSIMEAIQPDGVAVVIQAEHLCMIMRGIKKPEVLWLPLPEGYISQSNSHAQRVLFPSTGKIIIPSLKYQILQYINTILLIYW